jgi:MFS family permease
MKLHPCKIAILLSYISVASLSAAIITPGLPAIQSYFSVSHGALAWVVTIFLIGYMAGQLIYGPLANRFGKLTALRSGLILNLIGIVICLFAAPLHSFHLLLVGRIVTALGAAAGLSCTFMLINSLFTPPQAKFMMSFAVVSFTLGIGLAVLAGGLITDYLSWPDCFWLLLFHGILTLLSTWLFQETAFVKKSIHIRQLWHGYHHVLQSRKLVIFSTFVGLVSVISYTFSASAPLIAHNLLGLSPAAYGYWNIVNMIGMLAGGLSAAWILKHRSTLTVLYISLAWIALSIISLIIMAFTHSNNTLWFFITIAVMYFFASWVFPSASFLASHAMEDRASASSMMSFINMGAAVVSVLVMGYLPLSSLYAFIVTLGAYFLIVILFYLVSKNHLATEPQV